MEDAEDDKTTFGHLPIEVKLKIVKNCDRTTQTNVRQASRQLFELTNYVSKVQFTLTDDSLDVFRHAGESVFGNLVIKNLSQNIYTYKYRGLTLPVSKAMEIRDGISKNNIEDLFNVYVKSPEKLKIYGDAFFKTAFGGSMLELSNIKTLCLLLEDGRRLPPYIGYITSHVLSLINLLNCATFPCLSAVWLSSTRIYGLKLYLSQLEVFEALVVGLNTFMLKHGGNINEFSFFAPNTLIQKMCRIFEQLKNVKKLTLHRIGNDGTCLLKPTNDITLALDNFRNINTLDVYGLSMPLILNLMAGNRNLQHLLISNHSLDLYPDIKFGNIARYLDKLDITIPINDEEVGEQVASNWNLAERGWIFTLSNYARSLVFTYLNEEYGPSITDVEFLIEHCNHTRRIELRVACRDDSKTKPVSTEVEEWLFRQHNLECWMDKKTCTVIIK